MRRSRRRERHSANQDRGTGIKNLWSKTGGEPSRRARSPGWRGNAVLRAAGQRSTSSCLQWRLGSGSLSSSRARLRLIQISGSGPQCSHARAPAVSSAKLGKGGFPVGYEPACGNWRPGLPTVASGLEFASASSAWEGQLRRPSRSRFGNRMAPSTRASREAFRDHARHTSCPAFLDGAWGRLHDEP